MKNIICILSVFSLLMISCKKEEPAQTPAPTKAADIIQPVVSLTGNFLDTVSLNATYTDPGATAQDNVDGNITAAIVKTGSVNANLSGNYNLYYDVADLAGNKAATMTRIVTVANDADNLVGGYAAVPSCGATPTGPYNMNITSSPTINNQFFLSKIVYGSSNKITANISGSTITIPLQTENNETYSGTGTVSGANLSLTCTVQNSMGTYNCTVPHTKN